MAITNKIASGFEIWQHQQSASIPVLAGKAGATAITVGMPLIVSSGLLVPAAGTNADDTEVVGLAQSASTVSGTMVRYVPFWNGIVFVARVGSIANEDATPTTPADANRFESYGLGVDAGNGRYFVDLDNTTDALFCIIDIVDVGAVRGRVLVVPNSATMVWGV